MLLTACGAPALDREQAAVNRRTCASLRERVAARALDAAGPLDRPTTDEDLLSPLILRDDPAAFYTALDKALTDADLDPEDGPSAVSPASRLVDACRALTP